MRYIVFIFFFVFSLAQKDPRADKIIAETKKKLERLNDLTAQFSWTLRNRGVKNQRPITKRGTFYYKKGNRYRIETATQAIYCDGKTIWNYLKDDEEVTITDYDPEEDFSFARLFTLYSEGMKVRYDGSETIKGVPLEKITMFPKNRNTDYFKVVMWIGKDRIPKRMEVWGRNGAVITYELLNIKTNQGLQDAFFVFDPQKYPDIEVNDLR